jgi:O-antigen/teichoic acid export membrane protein
MVGQYALGAAISAPVLAFTNLQLRPLQASDIRNHFSFSDYLGLRLLTTLFAMLAIAGATAFYCRDTSTALVVAAVSLTKLSDSFSDILYGLYQKHERLDLAAIAMSLRGLFGLSVLCTILHLTHNIVGAIFGVAISWLGTTLLLERSMARRVLQTTNLTRNPYLWPTFNVNHLRQLLSTSFPLAVVMLLLTSAASFPQLVLARVAGEASLGLYATILSLSSGMSLLYAALGQSTLPRLSTYFAHDRGAFYHLLLRILAVATSFGIVVLVGVRVFGEEVVRVIYGPRFTTEAHLLLGLACVAVISNLSSLLGFSLMASRLFWPQVVISCLVLASICLSSLALIPQYLAAGAMYSALCGATVQLIAYSVLCVRASRQPVIAD